MDPIVLSAVFPAACITAPIRNPATVSGPRRGALTALRSVAAAALLLGAVGGMIRAAIEVSSPALGQQMAAML